jgi:hypothetical protein
MSRAFRATDWARLVWQSREDGGRDQFMGVSVTLTAKLLGITRNRVHQLIKEGKLSTVDVYDDATVRVGHLVTLASIDHRRRTVRPRRTQWRSYRNGVSLEGLNPATGLPDSIPYVRRNRNY